MTAYQVHETTDHYGSTSYVVTARTEPSILDPSYPRREQAEFHAEIANSLPEGYSVARHPGRANRMHSGPSWQVTDSDDRRVATWRVGDALPSLSPQEHLVMLAQSDARRASERAAAHVEQAAARVEREAEEIVQAEARRERVEHEAEVGPLATASQVRYILRLLAQRSRSGEGGGFLSGPTTREGIERMPRRDASRYIDSLRGDY